MSYVRPFDPFSHRTGSAIVIGLTDTIINSDCDSPFSLTNYTLDYLAKEWADEIDFVVCTPLQSPELRECSHVVQGPATVLGMRAVSSARSPR